LPVDERLVNQKDTGHLAFTKGLHKESMN